MLRIQNDHRHVPDVSAMIGENVRPTIMPTFADVDWMPMATALSFGANQRITIAELGAKMHPHDNPVRKRKTMKFEKESAKPVTSVKIPTNERATTKVLLAPNLSESMPLGI